MRRSFSIPTDEKGMTGRECPRSKCLGHFKVRFGTGLKGSNLPCVCPYCGHKGPHNTFYTGDQNKYIESMLLGEVDRELGKMLKRTARRINSRPKGGFGLSIKMEVSSRPPKPVYRYQEPRLETELTCDQCTLHYAIYGVFGYCPDCGVHNSRQILEKNLELALKELQLAEESGDEALREYLISDALENSVAAFDGFGRETAKAHANKATDPQKASAMSFQNLVSAERNVEQLFGFKLSDGVTSDEWQLLTRGFQKRHLLAHKMGVVDQQYLAAAGDPGAVLGRKVKVARDEVRQLINAVAKLGTYLASSI